jgi:hypothetical protein
MTAINSATTIPKGLKNHLPEPESPWQISSTLFNRISAQPYETGGTLYKKCEILPEDPECRFILQYFNHQKPSRYGIAKIFCIHTPALSEKFKGHLEAINTRAETFKPEWDKEACVSERKQVIQRWKEQANQFYPVSLQKNTTRKDTYLNVRVLPLWHGTSKTVCHSIASTGFTYFGKHHFFNPNALPGTFKNTDPGYFGSGIYFTTSAKYAAMYNSGNLLMAWVSMTEPFPVVNDVPHPQEGSDMRKFKGGGAYQTYNAHYIPVAPISSSPACMQYFPCYTNQAPLCDELVVTQEVQTLPRFWIELAVDFPTRLSPHSPIPGAFVVEASSLPNTLSPGLSVIAKCGSTTCSQKDQTQWISLGLGHFNMAEIYHGTPCPSCKIDFDAIDHFLLYQSTYALQGKRQNNSPIKIDAQKLPADQGIMISHFSGWKYLNINLN